MGLRIIYATQWVLNLPTSELQSVLIFDILHRRQGDQGLGKLHEGTEASFPWTTQHKCLEVFSVASSEAQPLVACSLLPPSLPGTPSSILDLLLTPQDSGLAGDWGTLFYVRTWALDWGT